MSAGDHRRDPGHGPRRHRHHGAHAEAEGRVMRVYVAGPMTGLPDFNYPAFRAAAARLRELGHEVEDPSENAAKAKPDAAWADYMRLGLAQVLTCDGLALLPGWGMSRGASLEVHVARALGMDVRPLAEWLAAGKAAA